MAQTTVQAVGISIIDYTISVTGEFGKTYSAGDNIGIYEQDNQLYISGKDWSNEIADASAGAVTQSTSYFNDWVNGQYTGDIANITNNITALSGDLSGYYKKTETSSKEQINDALQYVSAHAVGDVEVNNYVHNNSATIDEVNSAYKANSASYITAHQSLDGYATESWVTAQGYITGVNIPESAAWNDTSNVVSSNSASWSEGKTYEGVSPIVVNNAEDKISADTWTLSAGDGISFTENSANKVTLINVTAQGGGGSVSSKYGTISVDGSNIEATNKAIEFKSNGFTSSFIEEVGPGGITSVFTWDNYSQETVITAKWLNESKKDATLTYSSNTNVTGEVTAAANNSFILNVQIPNATAIQFTSDNKYRYSGTRVTAPTSFKISELAWKSDIPTYEYNSSNKISALNGSALVGNEDYLVEQGFVQNLTSPNGTISVLNNKVEGTNSAIASDVIEGFVSSYNNVYIDEGYSSTLTWERYVPNTMLFVSTDEYWQEYQLTYSANTDVTGVITVPTGGQVSVEIPSGTTSLVIGNENLENTYYNLTVSAKNYCEIGELAWASALPTFEYDSTNKISAINGSALAGGGSTFDPTYMSAQIDNKLNKSEIGFRKVNSIDYVSGISGKNISAKFAYRANTAYNADHATTASYDDNGNSLTTTYYNAQEANNKASDLFNFVQSNSANWGGGSSPSVDNKVLFYNNYSYDPSNGSQNKDTFVSGATELYFEAAVDSQQSTPSEIVIYRDGNEIGRAYWSQVSSDGSYNYLTASYNNADGGNIQIPNNNGTNYSNFYVSANGVKTLVFYQDFFECETDKEVKFNINGFNIVGQINGWSHGNSTPLTSFTGGLTDFTAKGYNQYDTNINSEDSNNSYNYNLSAEFGGSSIGGDVPSGTMNVSGFEYNTANEIIAYNGSAFAQPTLSSLNAANVNNIVVTASLPSTPDANTLYLIPEA